MDKNFFNFIKYSMHYLESHPHKNCSIKEAVIYAFFLSFYQKNFQSLKPMFNTNSPFSFMFPLLFIFCISFFVPVPGDWSPPSRLSEIPSTDILPGAIQEVCLWNVYAGIPTNEKLFGCFKHYLAAVNESNHWLACAGFKAGYGAAHMGGEFFDTGCKLLEPDDVELKSSPQLRSGLDPGLDNGLFRDSLNGGFKGPNMFCTPGRNSAMLLCSTIYTKDNNGNDIQNAITTICSYIFPKVINTWYYNLGCKSIPTCKFGYSGC